jgi:hypothetical protein
MSVLMVKPVRLQSVTTTTSGKVAMTFVLHVSNLETETVDDRPTMIDIEIDVTQAKGLIEGLKQALKG